MSVASDAAPTRLGKYRIIAKLGEGGMASVYLAVASGPSGFNKLLVLKVLKQALASDPEVVRLFHNEAKVVAGLNHPNIAQTLEVAEIEGQHLIVMEYLEGSALTRLRRSGQRRGGLPLDIHISILSDALAGLHHAHELTDYNGSLMGLVHRDLSAANIMVTFEGVPKVLDFGISKAVNVSSQTVTGVLRGTVRYMAPEVLLSETIDRRSDIYSAGVLLWEALAGKRMWDAVADVTVMHKVISGDMPALAEHAPDAPVELVAICHQALATDKEDRFQSASDLQTSLDEYLQTGARRPTYRDVGKLMESWYGTERAETKRAIGKQLAAVSASRSDQGREVISLAVGAESSSTRQRIVRDGRLGYFAMFAAAAIGAAAAWFLMASPGRDQDATQLQSAGGSAALPTPSAAPVTAPQPPPPDPGPAEPETVLVKISAQPPTAKLFVNGERLAGNPVEATYPKDNSAALVRAEAAGYETRSSQITLSRDVSVTLVLPRSRRIYKRPKGATQKSTQAVPPPAKQKRPTRPDIDRSNPWAN